MKKIIIAFAIFLSSLSTYAQSKGPTLNKRWEGMLSRSNNYQLYKVVKKTDLEEVWKAVQDSVNHLQNQLVREKSKIPTLDTQIKDLKKQVDEIDQKHQAVTIEKDNIVFLGAGVNKHTYVNILWVMIALIIVGAVILFFLFKNSNRITNQKKNEYDHLFKSFEEYKMSKIEMERKLRRELQTNMNMIEELKRHGRI